jgi:putative lipoic acid-binding regulatory protein
MMTDKTEQEYPREITFKAVFRTGRFAREAISSCLSERSIDHTISEKGSGRGNFISYTITAVFGSVEILDSICCDIKGINGFMMMV